MHDFKCPVEQNGKLNRMMYLYVNKLSVVFVLAILLKKVEQLHARHSLHECNVQYRCSDEKEYIWATDGQRCHVFHNRCLLKVEQCARQNRNKSELVEKDRETCKQHCHIECEDVFEPLCAQFFQEEYLTFNNECEMRNYMCSKERGKTFLTRFKVSCLLNFYK